MISVIVPVYKVEKYLNKCVESIVNQTYRDLEIILVDDGSPDNCPKMCDEWAKKDNRIKVIHKQNGGLSSARNAGLDIASGEYVTFVDSDDDIDLSMTWVMYNLLFDDIDLVICDYQRICDSDEVFIYKNLNINKVGLNKGELYEEVFGNLNNAVWNKLYRKNLIEDLRFPEGIIHGEDLIFNLNYIKKCNNAIKCDGKFYHYYSRENSITKSAFNEKKFFEVISKDIAKKIISTDYPEQINNANKFCFRARMNVLRAVYSSKKNKKYIKEVRDLDNYICQNFKKIKKLLKKKEIIEYYLYRYFRPMYCFVTALR